MTEATHVATAEGNLEKTPFAHLVLYLHQHASSGTLVLGPRAAADANHEAGDPESIALLFQRGRPVAARFPSPVTSLIEGLLPWCSRAAAEFAFYEADLIGRRGPDVVVSMLDPVAFVARAARKHVRAETIMNVLARYGDARLRLAPNADIARLGLSRPEQVLIDLLRADPVSVQALCELSELPVDATRRVAYVLVATKMVAPYDVPSLGAEPAKRRDDLSPLRPQSFTPQPLPAARPSHPPGAAMIGADSSAGRSSLPAARQAKAHAAAASLSPPRSSSSSGTIRAVQVPPTQGRSLTPSRQSIPAEALDSAGKLQRIEQLCQRRAYEEALPVIRLLVAEDPKCAKYQGLLAHALLGRTPEGAGVSKEVVDAVNQALRLDEDEVHALYTKALCYKRAGKEREALHYFKRTVAVDSSHLEAARELRLLQMRQASDDKDREKKGKR